MNRQSRLTTPTLLTLLRILTIPVVVVLLYNPEGKQIPVMRSFITFALFVAAAVTDLFDGYLARKHQMVTALGKLLDPLADKLLVCAALIMLIPPHRVPAWMVAIVVAREIGITALRGVASTEGVVIAASSLGKAKTLLLNIGTAALILHYPLPVIRLDAHLFGMAFLIGGIILTAWSGLDYFFRFVGEIFKK